MRLRNTAAVSAGAFALSLTAMLATAAPAGAAAPIPAKGHATFCLTAAATSALNTQGVVTTAIAPATLDTTGPTPCVTTPITNGSITVGPPLSGGFPLDGGISFTRTSDNQLLEFKNLNDDLTGRKVTTEVEINGGAPTAIDLVTYQLTSQNVHIDPNGVDITGPANLTQTAADAFLSAYEDQPVDTGKALFNLTVHLDL
ncbi:hypothetical protein ACFWVF_19150 [Streptomyces sp. NPDC058659]|uniref:hypothetical protein n=1 Tax=Streptomyces sp. NPDC058659 TaxID=3346581 RepID=UPI00365702FD